MLSVHMYTCTERWAQYGKVWRSQYLEFSATLATICYLSLVLSAAECQPTTQFAIILSSTTILFYPTPLHMYVVCACHIYFNETMTSLLSFCRMYPHGSFINNDYFVIALDEQMAHCWLLHQLQATKIIIFSFIVFCHERLPKLLCI